MFEDFEEWFAVRDRHDDEKICPAKLTFSQENGITLNQFNSQNSAKFIARQTAMARPLPGTSTTNVPQPLSSLGFNREAAETLA